MSAKQETVKLIIGCGFLGMSLLDGLLRAGNQVWATTRSVEKLRQIRDTGASGILLDFNQPLTMDNLGFLEKTDCELYFLLPPGQVEIAAIQNFLRRSQHWHVRRILMTSSTVVYGAQTRIVDADSKVDIDSPRAERQHSIEQAFINFRNDVRIVRLAGLYGSERIIGRQSVLEGKSISGSPDSYLNLIHVNDAAALLINIMSANGAAGIELGCDGVAVKRGKYYADLAAYLGCPLPGFEKKAGRIRGGVNVTIALPVNAPAGDPCTMIISRPGGSTNRVLTA